MKYLTVLLLFLSLPVFGQKGNDSSQTPFRLDSTALQGKTLNKGWRWHTGDNPDFAKPDFNDAQWAAINPSNDIDDLPQIKQAGFGWFRLRLQIDPKLANQIVRVQINQVLASEVYLDGKRIVTYGKVSLNSDLVEAYNPMGAANSTESVYVQLGSKQNQVLAVRFALEPNLYYGYNVRTNPCLRMRFSKANSIKADSVDIAPVDFFKAGIFFILAVLHLIFYFSFRTQKGSLYFAYTSLAFLLYFLLDEMVLLYTHTVTVRMFANNILMFTYLFGNLLFVKMIYELFPYQNRRVYALITGYTVLLFLLYFLTGTLQGFISWYRTLIFSFPVLLCIEIVRVTLMAIRQKNADARIILLGVLSYMLFIVAFIINSYFAYEPISKQIMGHVFYNIGTLCVPISFTIFTAKEFARTGLSLQKKLAEVKTLSAEKEQILTTQNETLELQVNERTAELSHKNQELVIEAALERVRTQSMAMQHSDQLQEVITVVSEQLQALSFAFDYVNFVVTRADRGWDSNNAVPTNNEIVGFTIPYVDHKLFRQGEEAIQQGIDFFAYSLTPDEKAEWLTYLFSQTILKDAPAEYKQSVIELPGMAGSVVVSIDLGFSIVNYLGVPYTDEENAIFKRFGAVFGQAYTRFLDLQKAEAQAKEAQIEAALERVRSRSLAMHSSEELKEVIALVFAQLNQVDVAITDGSALIILFTEGSKDVTHWTVNPNRLSEATSFRMPYFDHPVHNVLWDTRNKGIDFVTHSHTLEEKNSFWDQAFIVSDYKYVPEEAKQWIYDAPGYAFSAANEKHSGLYINSFAGKLYSEQENDILKRFARVFEQAYVRFLDLQKAEAQAKEAQIETALERVRSRSMAMQHSDDLLNVITVVSEQMQALGFQFNYVNFVVDRADRGWDCYNAVLESGEIVCFLIPYFDHRIFTDLYNARQQGLDFYTYTFFGEELSEWHTYLFTQTVYKDALEEDKQSFMDLPGLAASVVMWSDIALSIATYSGISYTDTENAIFKRFGAVFGQAYTRFQDLKKAEEQARQAIRTASLDRVRAQIASMRTAQDLERITPLIWTELTTLQVPFFRCGVFIVNEAQHRIQAFLSTPDGQARARLNLSIEGAGTNQQLLSSWQQQRVYRERWSHDQLQQWVTSMVEEGQLDSVQEYEVIDEVKDAFSLQFIPFRQGMLYVGSQEPLSESELDLAQSLADAFSVAYARYEDFRQLEEAKVRVDAALTELKSTQAQLIQKEKLASLGELTAGIAHEIQNPLNFVNNFSELSVELAKELKGERLKGKEDRDEELENELVDDLIQNQEKINHHGKRASSIVKGMLEHSRITTGERQLTDINQLTDEYLRLAYHGMRAKDSSFEADYELIMDEGVPKVEVVPQEIGRVLLNLINNGFYAVQEQGKRKTEHGILNYKPTLTLRTKAEKGQLIISVKDNGNGIPEAIKDKIFQPFFTTKPTGEGTGLGLSLAYDIVTKGHDGTMVVESRDGEGSEFVVRLPL
jgi:signal transduction histidine kinase